MSGSASSTEFCTIEASDGVKLDARIFKPNAGDGEGDLVFVLVHPYSILGGCQGLMKGMARGLANRGFTAVTFDMRGAGRSTGRPSITGFSEVNDVVSVCQWATRNLNANRILLVGSSAGRSTSFYLCFFCSFYLCNFEVFRHGFSTLHTHFLLLGVFFSGGGVIGGVPCVSFLKQNVWAFIIQCPKLNYTPLPHNSYHSNNHYDPQLVFFPFFIVFLIIYIP